MGIHYIRVTWWKGHKVNLEMASNSCKSHELANWDGIRTCGITSMFKKKTPPKIHPPAPSLTISTCTLSYNFAPPFQTGNHIFETRGKQQTYDRVVGPWNQPTPGAPGKFELRLQQLFSFRCSRQGGHLSLRRVFLASNHEGIPLLEFCCCLLKSAISWSCLGWWSVFGMFLFLLWGMCFFEIFLFVPLPFKIGSYSLGSFWWSIPCFAPWKWICSCISTIITQFAVISSRP